MQGQREDASARALPLALCQWSLHRRILGVARTPLKRLARALRGKIGLAETLYGDLDPLDFPIVARREFGFNAVEYTGFFYAPHLKRPAYLRELKRRCDDEAVRSLLIACAPEGEIGIGHPEAGARQTIVRKHRRWMDMAALLGCHAISVRLGSVGDAEEQARLAADGLRALGEAAAPYGLDVLVENHDGHTASGAWLADVVRRADHVHVGLAPDWGNFSGAADARQHSLAVMMPHARAVTAKCFDFNAAGAETTLDTARMLATVRNAGYRGHIGVEYEGARLNESDGIRAAKALLERHLGRVAAPIA